MGIISASRALTRYQASQAALGRRRRQKYSSFDNTNKVDTIARMTRTRLISARFIAIIPCSRVDLELSAASSCVCHPFDYFELSSQAACPIRTGHIFPLTCTTQLYLCQMILQPHRLILIAVAWLLRYRRHLSVKLLKRSEMQDKKPLHRPWKTL
ncbi:hypothetical protein DL93DRAFT_223804 [Clavulina sp. PMI_390]|nr:hypothetical protein DL93DRAFT_223804 [Clavulina sp. PMI_390]